MIAYSIVKGAPDDEVNPFIEEKRSEYMFFFGDNLQDKYSHLVE